MIFLCIKVNACLSVLFANCCHPHQRVFPDICQFQITTTVFSTNLRSLLTPAISSQDKKRKGIWLKIQKGVPATYIFQIRPKNIHRYNPFILLQNMKKKFPHEKASGIFPLKQKNRDFYHFALIVAML